MSYISTGLGLLQFALERAGESPTDTTGDYYAISKKYITRAILQVCGAAPFPWALKYPPGVLSLTAKVTGSVTLVSGTTWTLSTTLANSQAGKKVYLDSQ